MASIAQSIKRKYGAKCFVSWGKRGGSPILLAYRDKKAVKGYRVTKS